MSVKTHCWECRYASGIGTDMMCIHPERTYKMIDEHSHKCEYFEP